MYGMMETIARNVSLPKLAVPGTGSRWGRFIWHFLQMVVAMELGMMVYHHLLWPVLGQTLYAFTITARICMLRIG